MKVDVKSGQAQAQRDNDEDLIKKLESDEDYFLKAHAGEHLNFKAKKEELGCMLYDFLLLIDMDRSGEISAQDLDEAADIIRIAKKAKSNNSAELNYKHMPPAVAEVLSTWDADKSGSVGVTELIMAAEAQKKMKDENRTMKKLLVGAVIAIIVLMAGTFALALSAAELAKDAKPDNSGIVKSVKDDKPLAMGQVKEPKSLADMNTQALDELTRSETVSFFHDGAFHHYKVQGLVKGSQSVTLEIGAGHSLVVDVSGSVTYNGKAVDLSEGRRLNEESGRQLEFFSALQTSGSFTMMQAGGFRRL